MKCYPEQQKEVMKWMETIRREVLPENISSQVRTFQDDLYEVQAVEYILKDIISFFAIVSIIITLWECIPALRSIQNAARKRLPFAK